MNNYDLLLNGKYPFFKELNNVLLYGEPGVGKTELISKYKEQNNDFNFIYFHLNTMKLYKIQMNQCESEVLFSSKEIDKFEKENTIIVLEHIDLTNENVRLHLNLLLKDRIVIDPRVQNNQRKLTNNKLFILATAYPTSHLDFPVLDNEILEQFEIISLE